MHIYRDFSLHLIGCGTAVFYSRLCTFSFYQSELCCNLYILLCVIFYFTGSAEMSFLGRNFRGFKGHAPGDHMYGLLHKELYFSGDAGTGEPAGIRNIPVVCADTDDILPVKAELFRNVISKGNISVGPVSQVIAVAPDTAVLVDAVEGQIQASAFPGLPGRDTETVPSDSSCQIPGPAGILSGKGQGDRPVMGKGNTLPV